LFFVALIVIVSHQSLNFFRVVAHKFKYNNRYGYGKLMELIIKETNDNSLTLIHPVHQESYHSDSGALFESQNLYIKGSNLEKFIQNQQQTTSILDVGLGLGYNACSTIDCWEKNGGSVELLSLENDQNLVNELISGKACWQEKWDNKWIKWVQNLKKISDKEYQGNIYSELGNFCWKVIIGDARKTLEHYSNKKFHFVWQDAFSYKNSPELWSNNWFKLLKQKSSSDCLLLTYSVARKVKDNLEESGWRWEKIPTPNGKKKNWLKAQLK
jgi:tRNA U34 5-methylaminomethyl-2-thiouridine-forming methyltransferase MnmC